MIEHSPEEAGAVPAPAPARNGDERTPDRAEIEVRHLLDGFPAAAYICDPTGLITYFNEPAAQLWGRRPGLYDAADRFCGSLKLFSAEGAPIRHDQSWMALALQNNREYRGLEILIERPDGHRLVALAHASVIHDHEGRCIGAVNILVDITDRKRAQTSLRDADRTRNEFLATLAHELRNPLSPIRNAAKILHLQGPPSRESQWALDVIDRQVNHLTRLIDDLVDVARITSNKLELRRKPVSLGEAVQGAVETSAPQIESAGLELVVELPGEPLCVEGDLTRLSQVFSNLLDNSARYTQRGGRIWLTVTREGDSAVVRVRDTGIGIARDRISGIFEIFTKGDGSEHSAGGLGIGLTLARRLVELHGGTISASSEGLGRGSEFVIRLPIVEPPAPEPAPGPALDAHAAPPHRILVVDDNRDSAASLALLLRSLGHYVRTAYDGPEAVEAAEEFHPDVALLDLGLPTMNGYEVARTIRQRPWGTTPVLVAATGWGQEMDRLRSRDAGFNHHLVKPIELSTLVEILEHTPAAAPQADGPQPQSAN